MSLKIQLVKGSRVIYEMPLEMSNWTREQIRDELGLLEHEIEKVRAIHEMFK